MGASGLARNHLSSCEPGLDWAGSKRTTRSWFSSEEEGISQISERENAEKEEGRKLVPELGLISCSLCPVPPGAVNSTFPGAYGMQARSSSSRRSTSRMRLPSRPLRGGSDVKARSL